MTALALTGGRFLKGTLEDTSPEDAGGAPLHWFETCPGFPHLKHGRSFLGTSGFLQSEM